MLAKMRIRWVLVAVLAVALLMLAACGGTAGPAPAEEAEAPAAEAEAPAAEAETAAEEPAAAAAIADPVPYPDPPALDVGDAEPNRLPIDQIVTYKALDSYNEPEWIAEMVAAGELPPVEERLPAEPMVLLTSGMADGVGEYGGVLRGFSACPTAGWNVMANVTEGWFGIESYTDRYNALIKTGPLYRADQDVEPFPNLAKSWEWSEDGTELTMHLVEGAKWSDGEPFTSEDVMFTWEDYILDPNVNSLSQADSYVWEGEQATLEAIDDYTIKWTFPVAFPYDAFYRMREERFTIMPAHIMKPVHPKYNDAVDYKDFENSRPPDALPQITMGPFAATEYKTDELLIMRRNPYFWQVDEAGNQLPYFDEVVYQKGPSGVGRTLCTLAGGCDHSNLENPSTFVETLKRAQEPDAHFDVTWGPELLGYGLIMNLSTTLGVQDERDAAVRELFRDFRFRRAVSHAIDREGVAQSIMRGPFLRPWAGGLYPGAPEFDKESVVYYAYDPDSSKALLAELGFEDTDGNGILNWTEGPLAGEDLVLAITANEDQAESNSTAEALVSMLGQVGIKLNFRPVTSAARTEISQSGEWDMHVWRQGQEFALPFTRCEALGPTTKTAPDWHREGDEPRVLLPFEEELVPLIEQYCSTTDPAERKELIQEYNRIYTENLYSIGVFVGRYGLGLAKRFQNVPVGTPVFLYQWVEDAVMIQQLWTPAEEQVEQIRPNTIPVGQPPMAVGQ